MCSEECMGMGTTAQRLERTWHVPKLHGGVGLGGASACLARKQCHMAGHSSTAPRKASGPEVATGRCTLALKREVQRENEGPARRLRAPEKGEPSTFMQ